MTSIVLKDKITAAAAWKGADLKNSDSWVYHLSDKAIAGLDKALSRAISRSINIDQLTKAEFEIPDLLEELSTFAENLENGVGFLLLRGLPVERYSDEEISFIYYGIGLNLGIPVRQNPKGDLLGLVMNVGDKDNKQTRVYETNAYLPYHTDPSDVVGLLCLRKARQGGLSSLVSAASVYNQILEHYPEYLALFYRPMYYAHLGKNEPALSPIFSFNQGKLSCRYLRQYIELGHEMMGLPLSRIETEALDLFDSITHDDQMRLDMMLEPGDLQFANNYAVLHSRTEFEDYNDKALTRKMLRLWLKMPNARQLAPDFPGRNGFPAPQ